MFNYPEVYNRLNIELGIIIFMKKNGEVRVMLGTRNLNIASYAFAIEGQTIKNSLAGHDNRCNIKNGNIAVMDVMIGEARSFNIERLVDITYLGRPNNKEEFEKAVEYFIKYREEYERNLIGSTDINGLFE